MMVFLVLRRIAERPTSNIPKHTSLALACQRTRVGFESPLFFVLGFALSLAFLFSKLVLRKLQQSVVFHPTEAPSN